MLSHIKFHVLLDFSKLNDPADPHIGRLARGTLFNGNDQHFTFCDFYASRATVRTPSHSEEFLSLLTLNYKNYSFGLHFVWSGSENRLTYCNKMYLFHVKFSNFTQFIQKRLSPLSLRDDSQTDTESNHPHTGWRPAVSP